MGTTDVDLAELFIEHFKRTGLLPEEVSQMSADQIEELIDAISDSEGDLIEELRGILRREGVC